MAKIPDEEVERIAKAMNDAARRFCISNGFAPPDKLRQMLRSRRAEINVMAIAAIQALTEGDKRRTRGD